MQQQTLFQCFCRFQFCSKKSEFKFPLNCLPCFQQAFPNLKCWQFVEAKSNKENLVQISCNHQKQHRLKIVKSIYPKTITKWNKQVIFISSKLWRIRVANPFLKYFCSTSIHAKLRNEKRRHKFML